MTDWSEGTSPGSHYWYSYEGGAMCALTTPDKDCRSKGDRRIKVKCSACRMILHDECREDLSVRCRMTFRDVSFKKEQWTPHHWVLQRKGWGTKCKSCNKTLTKSGGWSTGRNTKSFIAVGCSWCKDIYHTSCFTLNLIEDHCTLGEFEQIIVPPYWILYTSKNNKKPDKRKISYSTRPSSCSSKRGNHRKRQDHEKEDCKRPFHIRLLSTNSTKTPLLVFVNPKSGGNQGSSLIHAFQWYLNPRQVFDMLDGGPTLGLQLYQNVANLRILVCGGDGSVGWVLSEIDKLNFINLPPVAILPLGTGNDLARVLNWGTGYTGEPVEKILAQVSDAAVHCLDRWEITVDNIDTSQLTPASPVTPHGDETDSPGADPLGQATTKLPVNIFNNYLGIGLDAHIQYQFHTGREAKPEKYNSRAYNKFVYFKGGLYDTFEQKYKSLTKFIELTCDGQDYTEVIREQKIHCIVFLNIKSYSGGANPWGSAQGASRPATMDDGFIEVVGLFSAPTMGALQFGLTGSRICQCRKVVIKTKKPLHCQVDGEPCYIVPSIMRISRRNQARMLMRWKSRESKYYNSVSTGESSSVCSVGHPSTMCAEESAPVRVALQRVTAADFRVHFGSLEKLQHLAHPLTMILVHPSATLDSIRPIVSQHAQETATPSSNLPGSLSNSWVFLHRANDRLYPISSDMETQLSVMDMVKTGIFILDTRADTPVMTSPSTGDQESACNNPTDIIRPDGEKPGREPSTPQRYAQ